MITVHMIVKNEERFIKTALLSVLVSGEVTRVIVWDTGSTDGTAKEIRSIKDGRIEFIEKGKVDRKALVQLRKEQLAKTETPWILLVDGDEIWPEQNLNQLVAAMKSADPKTIALVNRTRNAVEDVRHYLPESEGHYRIGSWRGHLNVRAIRNVEGLTVKGQYPNEWYELGGIKIQDQPERLELVDTWYLHTTHLKRSKNWRGELATIDRLKKRKWFYRLRGKKLLKMKSGELPEMLKRHS